MKMKDNLQEIYKLLTRDETLLRLLYYKPANGLDDPLAPSKANILALPEKQRWSIINDRIVQGKKVDDLDADQKCRLLFYPGKRSGTRNYLVANQSVVFDILVHQAFDNVDFRCAWICDRVNELLVHHNIPTIRKLHFESGGQMSAPMSYVGFRLVYEFICTNE